MDAKDVTRAGHRNLIDPDDPAGPCTHQDDAIPEPDRLMQVMGYEDDCDACPAPDFEQLVLQNDAA